MTWSPARIGTPSHDSLSTPPTKIAPCASVSSLLPRLSGARVRMTVDERPLAERPRRSPVEADHRRRSCTGALSIPDAASYRMIASETASKMPAHALADELDNGLELELLRQRLADLVDQGQLGIALVGLGQEALRLGEQAGVLEGDAHAGGER